MIKFIHNDKNRYKQIWTNLISNASKHTLSGGKIVFISYNYYDGLLLTKIKDNGIGIKQ